MDQANRLAKRWRCGSSSEEGQAGCKVVSRKSNKNKRKGAISRSLNDSFFMRPQNTAGKSIPTKPVGLNSRILTEDDFCWEFLCLLARIRNLDLG